MSAADAKFWITEAFLAGCVVGLMISVFIGVIAVLIGISRIGTKSAKTE